MSIDQIAILLIGTLCVTLSSFPFSPKIRQFLPWFGLLGEPFWYYATWTAKQWGMFGWTILTTGIFIAGIISWIREHSDSFKPRF